MALLFWGHAAGQDAAAFLRAVALEYLSCASYRAEAEVAMGGGSSRTITADWNGSPGASGRDMRVELMWPVAVGSHALSYDRVLRPQEFRRGESMPAPLIRVDEPRFVGEETLTVGGKPIACRVVEIAYVLPEERVVTRLWVDPVRHVVWKEESSRRMVTRTIVFRSVAFDGAEGRR